MIGYISTERQYRIQSLEKRYILAQTAVTFKKIKSDIYLLDEYFFIAMLTLLPNLPTNLSSISPAPKK